MSSASFAAPKITSSSHSRAQGRSAEAGAIERQPANAPATTPSSAQPHAVVNGFRRTADVLLSSTALLLLTPAFGLIALAVKATSPGPVLYRQTRVGWNRRSVGRRADSGPAAASDRRRTERREDESHGRLFEIVKFRTMVVNAEEYGPQWSSEDDPRITSIGKTLRLTRLDEIPQFWNVLRGDMSIIGPRPERPYFVDQFVHDVPNYAERLRARPGITGQAQVTLDYDANVDDVKRKVEADVDYLQNRSLCKDVCILLQTVVVILTGKGAK